MKSFNSPLYLVKEEKQYESESSSYRLNKDESLSGISSKTNKWILLKKDDLLPERNFEVKDKTDYISLKDYRRNYDIENTDKDLTEEDLNSIIKDFNEWNKIKNYAMFLNTETGITHFRELAKRGNSIYTKRLKAKILQQFDFLKDKQFSKDFYLKKSRSGKYYSNVFLITLTTNPEIFYNNKKKAWYSESTQMNLFLTNLRKQYGNIEYLSVVESTKKGYPHNHLVVIFQQEQEVFQQEDTKKWRMKNKKDLEKYWNSFIDVFACETGQEVIDYVFKDILKGTLRKGVNRTAQDDLTQALQWIFNKKSYSTSSFSDKGFLVQYFIHNDLTKESITQTDLRENIEEFSDGKHIFLGLTALKWKNGYNPPEKFTLKLNNLEIEKYCLFVINKKLDPKPKQEEKVLSQEQETKQEIKQYPEEDRQLIEEINKLRYPNYQFYNKFFA